jgi:hypothetical protein
MNQHRPLSRALALVALACTGIASTQAASAQIVWTGATGPGIFQDANWDFTASTVTTVDYTIPIADNVEFIGPGQEARIGELPGQEAFTVAEGFGVVIDNMRVFAAGNDGISSESSGGLGIDVRLVNGASLEPFFVSNNTNVDIDSTSQLILGGSATPINGSTVNLTFGARLEFLLEEPDDFRSEHLSKVTVDGAPAVEGVNIAVDAVGLQGSVVTVLPGSVGSNYCAANINSSGASAVMDAFGSPNAGANELTLSCSSMPALVFGFFIASTDDGFVANPGGSAGNLCLSGSIGRYVGPGQIQNSGLAGTISQAADLTAVPQPNGAVPALAGDTWRFQCWFRDSASGQVTSNFSDGLSITFL